MAFEMANGGLHARLPVLWQHGRAFSGAAEHLKQVFIFIRPDNAFTPGHEDAWVVGTALAVSITIM